MTLAFVCHFKLVAQDKDSTFIQQVKESRPVKKLLGLITRESQANTIETKSEKAFLKYEGKIIRRIELKRLGFEQSVVDTAQVLKTFVSRLANKIHYDTRAFVIRNHLFVKEGKPLNPYRVADNERVIRNLDFILDARILVKPISQKSDSVDLLVITRDIFSLGGSVSGRLPNQFNIGVKSINFFGQGQRIEYRQIYNTTRTPRLGYEFINQLTNVGGTFIDVTTGYTQLNRGPSIGNENERSFYVKISRGLFQPFTRVAGAIEFSDNISRNVFRSAEDSTFIQYHYVIQDYWVGYSFGYKTLPDDLRENRNRKFIALRVVEQRFRDAGRISFSERDFFAYRDRVTVLAQTSFFRQDFYETRYVVGFGRTEDIPYGYRISITGGIENELGNRRAYFGSEVYYDKILDQGTLLTYTVKSGNYWNRRGIEDGLFQFKLRRYSKARQKGRIVFRNQFEAGYSILFNQNLKRGVSIRDVDGIIGFRPDSLVGRQRITLSQETTGYLPWKVIGFRVAPIARVDIAIIRISKGLFRSRNFFSGLSVGLRARNENLIFNTIEARMFYYPVVVERVNHFHFTLTSNFRIKYPSSFVSKPATIFP
ncbi:hypothetical protein DQQ10_05545 [Pseudochryseolinea flava]|uniref:POTRA domain-containing protein n=2 Tax=Pseudochryseolinea flava TaxID=2059302 RepID=A0A364Y828_9BACT|nr:hypothetical protein DQQ10_05545 [Pseudochryseolinea flava]